MNIVRIGAAAAIATAALAVGPAVAPQAHADEVCGYSPRVVAIGPTSCPFALNVAHSMMSGGGGTAFSAYSPTTGDSYWMTCSIEHHGSTTCRGGDGAEVEIY
jgi:hypothetical protein